MRVAPTTIADMLDGTASAKLATCLKFQLRDGTEIGFTDLDEDVTVALANDLGYPVSYSAVDGMVLGDIDMATGLDADNSEVRIPVGGQITRVDVLGRRFNQARVYVFDIDHSLASPVPLEVFSGWIADANVDQGTAVFEIRSLVDKYNSVIGSVLSPRCGADYGDERCGKTKEWIDAVITAVESDLKFTLNLPGAYPDQYFRFGEVSFAGGELVNVWPMEVIGYTGATSEVELFVPAPVEPMVGDPLRIAVGCSRLKTANDLTVPTCQTHDNVSRFRGYDRVPGSDTYLKVAVPDSGLGTG